MLTDDTHDPRLQSWVASAHLPGTGFPIQNLPFGVFSRRGSGASPRVGIAIGDRILDVAACEAEGLVTSEAASAAAACSASSLNALMALGREHWSALRRDVTRLLRADTDQGRRAAAAGDRITLATSDAELHLPAAIGDYTDFYASVHHATNVGSMFRPDNPLLPNYKYVPVGYHGRASSIVVSGTPVRRPSGQVSDDAAAAPRYQPSAQLDYEMEVGCFVGPGNALGDPIPIQQAESNIFGLCLVNDWSARDIQKWEYQPLGPFLAKSFATSLSPWVVTLDALAPFRAPAFQRAEGDPSPLPYLDSSHDRAHGGFDLTLEVLLATSEMRARGVAPVRLSRGSFTSMYWTLAQMLTHHASNGCNLRPGDLLASGTVSGAGEDSRGCLLELTWRGTKPLELSTGETRRFLMDGDEVIMRGFCERAGYAPIGFGECRGVVLAGTPRLDTAGREVPTSR